MKKFQQNAIKCAIALFAAAGMVACSSEEVAETPVNPTYDGSSVKTQFAINVAKAGKGSRMSAENTQNGDNFKYLGMENVRLFTLAATPAEDATLTSDIRLVEPTQITGQGASSHIYSDVSIPVNTSDFLLYATRKDIKNDDDIKNNAETGAIESSLYDKKEGAAITGMDGIYFKNKTIKADEVKKVQDAFIAYLNAVVTALPDHTSDNPTTDLEQAKIDFIKNFDNNQRAGSAFSILKQMEHLYTIASGVETSDATNATAVKKAITGDQTIKIVANGTKLSYSDETDNETYSNFPAEQGLPDGAVLLTYNDGKFAYTSGKLGAEPAAGASSFVNIDNIVYPLPIVYFNNTPARASDISLMEWPKTAEAWNAGFTGWGNTVLASTRSIALENNINYGVAGLKTTVKCAKNKLQDNAWVYTNNTTSNQEITVPESGFPVTGLLIGGQPEQVGWQFVDETKTDIKRDRVVYDTQTNSAAAKYDEKSAPIYTLVFDNWRNETIQEGVNVAIELQNNSGERFYGQDGVIEVGQKFYLIGQLVMDDSKKITWPQYGTEGGLKASYKDRYPVKAGADRVFIQDYTTTANFSINSLTNAYVTIPDLRATKLQIGISVDLKWETGLNFDVTIE